MLNRCTWERRERRERQQRQIQQHYKECTKERVTFDQKAIDIVQTNPLEYGLIWIVLRNIILGFCKTELSWRPLRLEYHEDESGFRKCRTSSIMTNFVMTLAGVNRMWRTLLKSKCVFRENEWDFVPGCIDPPTSSFSVFFTSKQRVPHAIRYK